MAAFDRTLSPFINSKIPECSAGFHPCIPAPVARVLLVVNRAYTILKKNCVFDHFHSPECPRRRVHDSFYAVFM